MTTASAQSATAAGETIALQADRAPLRAEVAHTEAARQQGLMHRRQLPENHGMLFIFPNAGRHAMWMRNTAIPLSVAFVDERGVILNIEEMEPHSERLHAAAGPAKFALEVNRGWFAKRGIRPGSRLQSATALPAAE